MKYFLCFLIFSAAAVTGANAMSFFSNNELELKWEWPSDRKISHRIIVQVDKIKAKKSLISSPSLADNLPDPVTLFGQVVRSDFELESSSIRLVLPKIELGDVLTGSKLALGLVDTSTVVCTAVLPSDLGESEEADWLQTWSCG